MRAITPASIAAALCATAVALTAAPAATAADCANANATPGQVSQTAIDRATVCLLNQQRTSYGRRPLKQSGPLAKVATRYASYMVSTDHFAHQDEDGHTVLYRVIHSDPALASRWRLLGENLGWGTYAFATPRSMVAAWMASPSHRSNILCRSFRLVGAGVAPGAPVPGATNGLTYATVFGKLGRKP